MAGEFRYSDSFEITYKSEASRMAFCLLMNSDPEAWKACQTELNPGEIKELQRQQTNDAKNSFCFGKIAAKTGVSRLTGIEVQSFEIGHGIFGFPVLAPAIEDFYVSIGHTKNSGIAICLSQKFPAGIDIEEISDANFELIQSTFTAAEIRLISEKGVSGKALYSHFFWSAREALSKALKTGFLAPMHLFEIKSIKEESGYFKIGFRHFSLFSGLAFQGGNQVICLVVPVRLSVDLHFIQALKNSFKVAVIH